MKEPRIRQSDVQLKMVGGQFVPIAPEQVPVPAMEAAPPRPWHTMEEAPRDGTLVEMKEDPDHPDDVAKPGKWRATRRRDGRSRRWVQDGWWVDPVTGQRLMFEPFCWRHLDGFLEPGMVVS